jgi:hypothetical protein
VRDALPPLPTRRLLTAEEAAGYCGISVGTLQAHVPVSPLRLGAAVRYDVRALDKWLDERGKSSPMTGEDWLGLLDEDHGARA